jgi:hypothetical protein
MDAPHSFHDVAALLTAVVALAVGVLGLVLAGRDRRNPRLHAIWGQLLALTHTGAVAVALSGFAEAGDQPHPPVTRLYSLAMLAAAGIPWTFRTNDARWNTRMFSIAALVLAGLSVRALQTG